jgi:hypothetical protein
MANLEAEGLALVARDDDASLDRAAQLMQGALRADPGRYQARADLALIELLQAAARRDEASRLASAEGDALMQSGRDLRERALDELRPLVRDHGRDTSVIRALALYYGLDGNAVQTARLVAQAREKGGDPWIDFAELASNLRNRPPQEALPRLTSFVSSHRDLLRPRVMLARLQLERSARDESLRTLDDILAANPSHDEALKLKAWMLAPPPAQVAAVPLPAGAPPPQRSGHLPRKRAVEGPPRQRHVTP